MDREEVFHRMKNVGEKRGFFGGARGDEPIVHGTRSCRVLFHEMNPTNTCKSPLLKILFAEPGALTDVSETSERKKCVTSIGR